MPDINRQDIKIFCVWLFHGLYDTITGRHCCWVQICGFWILHYLRMPRKGSDVILNCFFRKFDLHVLTDLRILTELTPKYLIKNLMQRIDLYIICQDYFCTTVAVIAFVSSNQPSSILQQWILYNHRAHSDYLIHITAVKLYHFFLCIWFG